MDRDQLTEHLRFAKELGVAGISRDSAWRARRADGNAEADAGDGPGRPRESAAAAPAEPIPMILSKSPADALAAIRADLGEYTRCKLHTLGRRQIVFGVGNP